MVALSAGVTSYLRQVAPATQFSFVEPLGGASLKAALEQGGRSSCPRQQFRRRRGGGAHRERPFAALDWVSPDQVLLAPEDRICITMLEMLNVEGIVLEPGRGAVGRCAARTGRGYSRQDGGLRVHQAGILILSVCQR